MSGTFYRTYRPQLFSELVGQELIRLTLQQSIKEGRPAQAYLFTGPRGTGKTTTARILAKAANCLDLTKKKKEGEPCDKCSNCLVLNENKTLDLIEIDAASYTGVDNIRQLTENINLAPSQLKYKIFIIDEVHMLSKGAFNALLKTLEEPPDHTIFVLATTEEHKVPATVASRCQRYSFRLLTLPEIVKKLKKIARLESLAVGEDSLELIAEAARGGMRDAESLLAQVATLTGKRIKVSETIGILGISQKEDELKILQNVFLLDASLVFDQIEKAKAAGVDFPLFTHNLLENLRKILFLKVNPRGEKLLEKEISERQIESLKKISGRTNPGNIIDLASKIIQSQPLIKNSSLPHLALELALVEWIIKRASTEDTEFLPPNLKQKSVIGSKTTMPTLKEKPKNGPTKGANPKKKVPGSNSEKARPARFAKANAPAAKLSRPREQAGGLLQSQTKSLKEEKEKKIINIDLKTILGAWTKILQNVKDIQPALFSLLKVSSPVRVEDETLIISTPFKFHKDRINDGRNRQIFCTELEKVVGLKKICVVEDSKLSLNAVKEDDLISQVKNLL
ncbi:MAG: DNA polymerase III subunit gamma/tau [Candidatus Moranbacteria bacterium]|nr:DNA polymerase III subunit gamma/tau [Candidatus Moranbacteria bacterium]